MNVDFVVWDGTEPTRGVITMSTVSAAKKLPRYFDLFVPGRGVVSLYRYTRRGAKVFVVEIERPL